jgi:hypothetical protein
MNSEQRKFSVSKVNDNSRKSIVKTDKKFEFNAPKFYDLLKENDKKY